MFKICNKCGFKWVTRDDFLSDTTIEVIGYQVFFEDLLFGLYMFNHSCGTTIAVEAEEFFDLYDGPVFTQRKPGSRKCPGKCKSDNIMNPCSSRCRCAHIYATMQIMKKRKAQ